MKNILIPSKLTSKEAQTLLDMIPDYEINETGPHTYQVGKPDGVQYTVDTRDQTCTCPDFKFRGRPCKHIIFADYVLTHEGPDDLDRLERIAGVAAVP